MPRAEGLLLAHGAGGGADHRTFLAIEQQLDIPVHRMEFPYRREGRRAPDRAPKLIAAVVSEAEAFAMRLGVGTDSLVLGGRSMGGRMCSMAVAEGLPAAGLALFSYPLHPPGKPERLRIEHFASLDLPVLMINGDRDPFGSPVEFDRQVGAIRGALTLTWLEGHRHDPKPSADETIVSALTTFIDDL